MMIKGRGAAESFSRSSLPQTLDYAPERRFTFLISCGRRKLGSPAPARDLYTSPRFRAACRLAEEWGGSYYVVSAKHGLVLPHVVLEPYDQSVEELPSSEQERWASSVADDFCRLGSSQAVVLLARGEYARLLEGELCARGISVVTPLMRINAQEELTWLSQTRRVAVRRRHLSSVYSLINDAICAGHSFLLGDLSKISVPRKGVYVFLDDAETSFLGERPRIVRIGTHGVSAGSKSTLRNRLRNHLGAADGSGNHRGSIFRLHVGQALIAQQQESSLYPAWGSGQDAPREVRLTEIPMEQKVSAYLSRLRVVTLEIDDPSSKKSLRAHVESNLIALMTEEGVPLDPIDPNWLGNWASAAAIRANGLWNVRDVGRRYDERVLPLLVDRLSFHPTLI